MSTGVHEDSDTAQDQQTQATVWHSNRHCSPQEESNCSSEASATSRMLGLSFLASVIACISAIHFLFADIIPYYYTTLAIALSLPMAVVGIRSLAETDYNPESALGMHPPDNHTKFR